MSRHLAVLTGYGLGERSVARRLLHIASCPETAVKRISKQSARDGRLALPYAVRPIIVLGTTLIFTDLPVSAQTRSDSNFHILTTDAPAPTSPSPNG
jgi:hypothetical protein